MQYVNQLSEAIRRYRVDHQMSFEKFAKVVGITTMALYRIERGFSHPAPKTLRSMAKIFEWTAEDVGAFVLSLPDEPRYYVGEGIDGGSTDGSAPSEKGAKRFVVEELGPGDGF